VTDRFARAALPGGLTVLTEEMTGVRSVSLGVWVRSGPIHENAGEMGVNHLLEHMVFKGTEQRTAMEIAQVLERLGGSLDAYTTREYTSYQARVLDEHLDIALDVLADLVLRPLLRQPDLELEREVVLEEIATVEDTPDDLVFDMHAAAVWGDHPYGYSILGTRDTVAALGVADLRRIHERAYRRPQLIVAAAGNVEHDRFVERVAEVFGGAPDSADEPPFPPLGQPTPREERIARDSTQTHIVFGAPTFGHGDPRRYALVLLSHAFGGCMSSRLFQKVREELGLAYAVYSFQSFYRAAGLNGVYVGTRHEYADRAADAIRGEYARVAESGLTAEELSDVKGQMKGQIVLSLESSSARLHRLAGTALYGEPFRTIEEVMACIDAVTDEEVAALAAEYFAPERQVVLRLGAEHGRTI
jgi:predicted Zn-dependent peptidase